MSLQSDLVSALSSVAGGKVYPQFVPADVTLPFIVYSIISKDPLETLSGGTVQINSTVEFDCYADDYTSALSLAQDVKTAIDADANLVSYETSSPGENYEPAVDVFMEPVFYGFWHT